MESSWYGRLSPRSKICISPSFSPVLSVDCFKEFKLYKIDQSQNKIQNHSKIKLKIMYLLIMTFNSQPTLLKTLFTYILSFTPHKKLIRNKITAILEERKVLRSSILCSWSKIWTQVSDATAHSFHLTMLSFWFKGTKTIFLLTTRKPGYMWNKSKLWLKKLS